MYRKLALVLVMVAAVVAMTPASPIHLSYVTSNSMEPTIGVDDGYVVIEDSQIESGEIAVFWSDQRGEYVTHRVVDQTAEGFVTKGDNNDVTDQATGHPHVQRTEITGTVLTVDGEPLIIPHLGVVASLVAGNRLLAFALGGALLVGSFLFDSRGSRPGRSIPQVSDVTHPLLAMALIIAISSVVLGGVSHGTTYVVTEGSTGGTNALQVGEMGTDEITIHVTAIPFTYRMVDTKGMSATDRESNASLVSAQFRIPAQANSGTHETSLTVYRYPAVLPEETVRTLHAASPLLAAIVTAGILFTPILLVYTLLFDGKEPLRPFRAQRRLQRGSKHR